MYRAQSTIVSDEVCPNAHHKLDTTSSEGGQRRRNKYRSAGSGFQSLLLSPLLFERSDKVGASGSARSRIFAAGDAGREGDGRGARCSAVDSRSSYDVSLGEFGYMPVTGVMPMRRLSSPRTSSGWWRSMVVTLTVLAVCQLLPRCASPSSPRISSKLVIWRRTNLPAMEPKGRHFYLFPRSVARCHGAIAAPSGSVPGGSDVILVRKKTGTRLRFLTACWGLFCKSQDQLVISNFFWV